MQATKKITLNPRKLELFESRNLIILYPLNPKSTLNLRKLEPLNQ